MKKSEFKINNVAIYLRLSLDDEQKGESQSISNQRDLLVRYVTSQGWKIYDIYVDDGYSGLNINRPDFQRMISDIEDKKINIVITKDLSRLGRNYLQTGFYTDTFFPKNGVRYIALNDGVDTIEDNNEIVPFKNILNEFYSRDVSKKIRSAYLTRARQGKFIGCLAPFGYMKNPDDKYQLIEDKETSFIIRKIFDLAKNGLGVQAIRGHLRKAKIQTPTWWNRKKGLRNIYTKLEKTIEGGEYIWDCTTLTEIIQNPVYIGHTASQKANYKFKVGWINDKPASEWLIVENTHEPIVDVDTYKIANEKLKSRKRRFKTGELNMFSGLLKCPDCGKSLNIGKNNSKHQEKLFSCNSYRRYGKVMCTAHKIFYDELYNAVLNDIRTNAKLALKDEKSILAALNYNKSDEKVNEHKEIAKKIEEDSQRYKELERKVARLYDDWLDKKISEANFETILAKTQEEQNKLETRINELEQSLETDDTGEVNTKKWIELIKQYKNIKKLNKTILNELISKIYVYEKEVVDDELVQVVEIYYNFIGTSAEILLSTTKK